MREIHFKVAKSKINWLIEWDTNFALNEIRAMTNEALRKIYDKL